MGCPSVCELEDTLVFSVCTHDPDTGVLTDADAVPSYRIYEEEAAAPILTGNMAKLDDAGTTGFYTETINATAANGFEVGKTYTIYITATVDGDTGGIAYSFKMQHIHGRLPAALVSGRMSSDAVAISGSTTAADRLEASAETMVVGAAVAGTLSTTQMTTNLTEATDDHYNGRIVIWTSGVLTGQATDITDYDGGSKKLTYTGITEAPGAGDMFIIV